MAAGAFAFVALCAGSRAFGQTEGQSEPAPASPASESTPATTTPPAATPASAIAPGKAPATTEKVIVTGGRLSDTDERRSSTASKMVFGREELDRYGDTSLGEVLKRLPGVTIAGTPGRGGDIRMRGLGRGYTLILINGEPAPRGFSFDSLPPDQVERIEIFRAPVAEHSARAIAGTINIVLREEFVKRENEVRPGVGWEEGRFQPGVSVQRSDNVNKFGYNIGASVYHRDLPHESATFTTATNTESGATVLTQEQHSRSDSRSDGVNLNARMNWKLDGGDNFVLIPFVTHSRSRTAGTTTLDQSVGFAPAPYALTHWRSAADSTVGRAIGNLRLRFADGARLELRFNAGQANSDNRTDRDEFDSAGGLAHVIRNSTGIRDTSFSTGGKYSRPLEANQQFAAGWEFEAASRRENASSLQDGVDPLARYGDDIEAQTRRIAAYVQDEWDISPLWAAYGGLRWETIRTASESALNSARNRSSVLSPLLHSVWRFDADSKDLVRAALTRTYRTPTLSNLVAVPTLSSTYPAYGPNTPTSPDSVGNPDLKPELAWGLDFAFEHYFAAGGLLSASVFLRSIDDLIRNVTTLQAVNWSPQPRWVSSPQNFGHATSRGVELEAKFRLDELIDDAPKINLRANYSRYWSSVDDVPGPYNRLDQQPRQTANIGVDYRLSSVPLTLGGNCNWTQAFYVQQTAAQGYRQGTKRVADAYALWRFNPDVQVRLSASNLLAADYATSTREVFGTTDQRADTIVRTYRSYALRAEIRF